MVWINDGWRAFSAKYGLIFDAIGYGLLRSYSIIKNFLVDVPWPIIVFAVILLTFYASGKKREGIWKAGKFEYVKNSMELTHRWLDRCIKKHNNSPCLYKNKQHLFPIVQGGVYSDLRKESAEFVSSKFAEGYAIGGLSVGEPNEEITNINKTRRLVFISHSYQLNMVF